MLSSRLARISSARVIIPEATLKRHRACRGRFDSPWWDAEQQALVYENWDQAVTQFLSTEDGTERLEWLVGHGLVPMTKEEFATAKAGTHAV